MKISHQDFHTILTDLGFFSSQNDFTSLRHGSTGFKNINSQSAGVGGGQKSSKQILP
jgi:hypothetical protein